VGVSGSKFLPLYSSTLLLVCVSEKYRKSNLISLNRYGLPVNFSAIVIHPTRKGTKRLREVLDRLFGYLDQSDKSKTDEVKPKAKLNFFFLINFFFLLAN